MTDLVTLDDLIRYPREQMRHHVDPAAALVDRWHFVPGRLGDVGVHEHAVFRAGVVLPFRDRQHVVGTEFPPSCRIFGARAEPSLLFGGRHAEPVLEEEDAVFDEHALEDGRLVEEAVVLGVRAVAHDVLHAGAVVPGAIHQHDLAGGRQVRHSIAGSTTGCARVGRRRQRRRCAVTRGLRYSIEQFDSGTLAGGIAPLEDHHDARSGRLHPTACMSTESSLQATELLFVGIPGDPRNAHAPEATRRVPVERVVTRT